MGDSEESNFIQLRIVFPSGLLLQEHKTFRFDQNETVRSALHSIQAKTGICGIGEFGLYLAPDGPHVGGVWMHEDRPLSSYHLKNHDNVELKCRARNIKVLIEESKSVSMLMVDYSVNVSAAIAQLCEQAKLKSADDFVLQNGNFVLDPFKSLRQQYPSNSTGILLLKRKPKQSGKGKKEMKVGMPSKMFGVSLRVAIQNSAPNATIPLVVDKCIGWLSKKAMETHSLFMLTGKPNEVEYYQSAFDHGDLIEIAESADPYAVACVLKNFFRDLAQPLIPSELYFGFLSAHEMSKEDLQIQGYCTLFKIMPEPNRVLLFKTLNFLSSLSHKQLFNHMSEDSLGKVFGPLFLKPPDQHVQTAIYNMSSVSDVVSAMIKHIQTLLKPPPQRLILAVAKETVHEYAHGALEVTQGDHIFVQSKEDGFCTAYSWGKLGFIAESMVQFLEEDVAEAFSSSRPEPSPRFPDTEIASFKWMSLLPVRDASKYQNLMKDVNIQEVTSRIYDVLKEVESKYEKVVSERCEFEDTLQNLRSILEQERKRRELLEAELIELKETAEYDAEQSKGNYEEEQQQQQQQSDEQPTE